MHIISIFRNDATNELIAFIEPFYAGDNIHECKLVFSNCSDFFESVNKSILFSSYKDAHKFAFNTVYNYVLNYDDYY